MRAAAIIVVATAGIASAQSTSCAAQNILDSCLQSTKIPLDNCAVNDWQCMCDAQTSILTCYNNCPADQGRFAASSQQTSWCNAAKQFSSTTSSVASSLATSAASAASSASSAIKSASSRASGSAASATASSFANAADGLMAPASGLFAVALGIMGFM